MASKKTKWLQRVMVTAPLYYRLCLSKKEFRKVLAELGIKDEMPEFLPADAAAQVHYITNRAGAYCCVVCFREDKHYSIEDVHKYLTHEAVHICCKAWELLGEDNPSSEFMAYSVENIAAQLFEAYRRQGKYYKHKRKGV